MAIGWDEVQRMKRVEAKAEELGFKFSSGNYTYGNSDNISYICLKPKEDCLPHYSRDAEIFTGTLGEISIWLSGIEWARTYEELLKLSSDKKRGEREQAERNKQLLKMVKTGKKVEGKIGLDITPYELDDDVDYDAIPF